MDFILNLVRIIQAKFDIKKKYIINVLEQAHRLFKNET